MNAKVSRSLAVIAVLSISAGLVAFLCWQLVGPSRTFREQVGVGLTKAELVERVGEPAVRLMPGDVIPSWGNSPEHRADREAWVYFVFPKSQHRFVALFEEGVVDSIEHDLN